MTAAERRLLDRALALLERLGESDDPEENCDGTTKWEARCAEMHLRDFLELHDGDERLAESRAASAAFEAAIGRMVAP